MDFRGMRVASTATGALFVYAAAPASLVLLPLAALPAIAWAAGPYGLRIAVALACWVLLIGTIGLIRPARAALAWCVRRLLAVPVLAPVADGGGNRWRTALWLVVHAALGWVGGMLTILLVTLAVVTPGNWLHGDGRIELVGRTIRLGGGPWSWVIGVACLLAAVFVALLVVAAARWAAPRLLGPSAGERLVAAERRERELAERNRLAHELHDTIGHTLTTTTIQAAVASEMMSRDPAAARAALAGIEESARAALADLDYLLGVLREEPSASSPPRTLADLPELIDRLRRAGAAIDARISGRVEVADDTQSRAAYRIVQEGLTNALRHGRGPICLDVACDDTSLELAVVNDRAPCSSRADSGVWSGGGARGVRAGGGARGGRGLVGLAERVRLARGEIEVGPAGESRWRLAVRLPVSVR